MERKILRHSEMGPASFEIFEPVEKKFRLTPNWIVLITWSGTIFLLWVFDRVFPPNGAFRIIWLGCVLVVTFYFIVASFFTYKPLDGVLNGEIVFNNDNIVVNDNVFALANISDLDFSFNDYYGKSSSFSRDVNPSLYQGVNNYVTFLDRNNDSHFIYFKLQTQHSYLSLSSFINEAIKLKKMEFKRAIDLLGIENVSIN